MNSRLKTRLILYPIIIIAVFIYGTLHQKIKPVNQARLAQPATTTAHPNAQPNFLLKTMATLGLTQSQIELTQFYLDNDEFSKARPIADKIYASSNAAAINNIGSFFEYKAHYADALKFYKKAAYTYNLPLAEVNLGALYMSGHGVTKNVETAKKLFQSAANAGNAIGQYNLGILYASEGNIALARRYLNLAASNHDTVKRHDAQKALAKIKAFEETRDTATSVNATK